MDVTIRGDNIVEGVESFMILFSSEDERDVLLYDNTTVSIIDDDGKNIIMRSYTARPLVTPSMKKSFVTCLESAEQFHTRR